MVSKKRKREEKNKTQLKKPRTAPGNHLPKGTNVTKTEFRVAKIVIPGQAGAPSQGGPTTRKRLGLKEVLHKLGHFSQTVRADGLDGWIKEEEKKDKNKNMIFSFLGGFFRKINKSLFTPPQKKKNIYTVDIIG